jgi:hypothetical protein
MFVRGGIVGDLALILVTWLIIAMLPRVLRWVKLEDRFERKHLSLLNVALLGAMLWLAVVVPLAGYLRVYGALILRLFGVHYY